MIELFNGFLDKLQGTIRQIIEAANPLGQVSKELYQLTLRECAMLAGMTTNPYHYNIRRNLYLRTSPTTDYVAITRNRTNYVLRMMYENQFITHAQYMEALEESTANVLRESPESRELYPYVHYVEYAVKDVIQALLRLNNLENTAQNRAAMERELREAKRLGLPSHFVREVRA